MGRSDAMPTDEFLPEPFHGFALAPRLRHCVKFWHDDTFGCHSVLELGPDGQNVPSGNYALELQSCLSEQAGSDRL